MAKSLVAKIQDILGEEGDGIWGPKSQAALNKEIGKTGGDGNPVLAKIQKLLGVGTDGFWGPVSQQALNDEREAPAEAATRGAAGTRGGAAGFRAIASSFADPADVVAFQRCKAQGKTDQACFKVGDNGIGQFGKLTAQDHTPMVAIHKDDMIARWGSVMGAAHRIVNVTINGKTIQASVEDRLGVAGRIDLNPACAKQLGLNPPFLVRNCVWSWE
jgi:hypothetical protein